MLFLAAASFIFFFIIAAKRPVLALLALAALLPSYNLRFTIFNLPTTILEFIIWGMFLGWLIKFGIRNSKFEILFFRLRKIKWPLALFFIASAISIFISPDLFAAFGRWRAFFLESGLVFIMILSVIKDKKDFEKIIFGLSISALYLSAIAIGQKFFGLPNPFLEDPSRTASIFTQPNMLGLYLCPIILLIIGQIISNFEFRISNKIPKNIFLILTAGMSIVSLFFAQSDGAAIGVIGGISIFLFLLDKKTRAAIIIVWLLFLGYWLFAPNNNLSFIKDKLLLRDWSGFVRLNIWRETWAMLKDNWLLGAGIAGYPIKILPYHASRDWMDVYPAPHTLIFNFWSEIGLLGLGAFLWLLEKFGRMCYILFTRDKAFAACAIAAMSALLIHGLVDVPYFKNDLSILFWIIFSMPFICHSRPSDNENIRESSL